MCLSSCDNYTSVIFCYCCLCFLRHFVAMISKTFTQMLNTLAHYLISFISTMNIKKQQAHYRYVIYIQYVLYSCNTYHVTHFSCMQWSLLNSMKHDFDYAQKYNQKTQLWLHFDQPNVCSCPTILTSIDICLGQKRNKDKAERKKTIIIKQKQNKEIIWRQKYTGFIYFKIWAKASAHQSWIGLFPIWSAHQG